MQTVVHFDGITPIPRSVSIGMERDNLVTSIHFDGLPEYAGGKSYFFVALGKGADVIEIINGTADVTRTLTRAGGVFVGYVEIQADGDVVWHSQPITLIVGNLPDIGDMVERELPSALEDAIKQSSENRAAAEASAKAAQEAAESIVTKENERVAAEDNRVAAEETREAQETARKTAEEERQQAEAARGTAETAREKAEAARAEAEKAREKAETARAESAAGLTEKEAARETAEQGRVEAEQQRVKAEDARVVAENARTTAEQSREMAEVGRVDAEAERQAAAREAVAGLDAVREEWQEKLDSGALKGEKGDKGDAGVDGKDGKDGAPGKDGADGLDAPQIDDTAITSSNPWSSKQIIDTLCPPLEESGNPAVCYPVAGYPIAAKASWEPTQEGSGTPSPDNIRPISGRDSVTVERCGRNLLDAASIFPAKKVSNGITWTNNKDGSVSADGTATSTGYYDSAAFILAAGTYTICAMPKFRITVLRRDDRTSIAASAVGTSKTFTLNENTKCTCFIACVGTFSNEMGYPCIVQGAADTGWMQYRGDTYTLALPETVYGGTVDAQTGEGQETWKLLTLDGTEAWITPSSNAYYAAFGYAPSDSSTNGIASHYPYGTGAGNMYANKNGAAILYGKNSEMTLDEWKTYLAAQYTAGTPVQIAYKLATPTAFAATGGAEIKALAGTNTLMTDGDSLNISSRADPIHIIQQLQSASTAATQALNDATKAIADF